MVERVPGAGVQARQCRGQRVAADAGKRRTRAWASAEAMAQLVAIKPEPPRAVLLGEQREVRVVGSDVLDEEVEAMSVAVAFHVEEGDRIRV
jgi:hypothetical protein